MLEKTIFAKISQNCAISDSAEEPVRVPINDHAGKHSKYLWHGVILRTILLSFWHGINAKCSKNKLSTLWISAHHIISCFLHCLRNIVIDNSELANQEPC